MIVFGLLNSSFVFAQETQSKSEDLTKYTVRQYLEANLPPQEGRKIVLDEITGLLTVTDTPTNQELALRLIKEWDIGPKQIQIEAKFIEITFTDIDEMGVNWDLVKQSNPYIFGPNSALAGGASSVVSLMGAAGSATAWAEAANTAGLGFLVGHATMKGSQILMYLKALAQTGKANLIHAPRVTTLSGQMANLQVIRSFPYATSSETTEVELTTVTINVTNTRTYPVQTYKIEEEITGVTLEVTPTVIEGSDIITLDIHPEVTKLTQQVPLSSSSDPLIVFPPDLGWPIIDTRTAQTSVMIRSGESILIGGLIQDKDDSTIKRRIPILGDLPLVGGIFRYDYQNREKKNLIVLLTAKLIDTQGEEIRQ